MNKYDRCDRCPDEDTSKCYTCREPDQEPMGLTYTFVINEEIYNIEGLHNSLDSAVDSLGLGRLKSTLESPDEVVEHDYKKEVFDE